MIVMKLYLGSRWSVSPSIPLRWFWRGLTRFFPPAQAFRPGIVDMTEEQLAVNKNAITLQGNDLDLLLPDLDW